MGIEVLLYVVGVVVFVILIIVSCKESRSSSSRTDTLSSEIRTLNAPLLHSGHRLEIATGDASAGFSVCHSCHFENFKRLAFCSLCDAKLTVANEPNGGGGKRATRPLVGVKLSQRARRAKSRRDWTRKFDSYGLYWQQHENWESKGRRRGFAMSFVTALDASVLDSAAAAEPRASTTSDADASDDTTAALVVIEVFPDDDDDAHGVTQTDATTTTTTTATAATLLHTKHETALLRRDTVVQRLDVAAAHHTLVLEDASTANPAQRVLESAAAPTASIDWPSLLTLAAKDFPTRYAHFVTTCATALVHASQQYIKLTVAPNRVLADSIEALSVIPQAFIHSVTRVEFAGAAGIDAGALQREWFGLLNQALADSASGVFTCVDPNEQVFYLNANAQQALGGDYLLYAYGAGRFVGRSLLDGQALHFHLALPLLKLMLGVPLVFKDLEALDAEAYQSLKYVIHNSNVDALSLTFSVMQQSGAELVEIDLIENGRDIGVTDDNKFLYFERRFRYVLLESVSRQLFAFLQGLYEVVPQEQLLLFDPEELDYVLCGSDEIDVGAWERNTRRTRNLSTHDVVQWFWSLVRAMPNAHRRRLLHFATGSSRVPLGGFRALTSVDGQLCPFTLYGVALQVDGGPNNTTEYIRSHACFNRLDLPLYESRAHLEQMLRVIVESEEHGFTIE